MLTRHRDVLRAVRDPTTFSSAHGLTVEHAQHPEDAGVTWADGAYVRRPTSVPIVL